LGCREAALQWESGSYADLVILAGSRRQLQVCGRLPSVKRFVRKLRGVRSPEARVITLWYYSRVLTFVHALPKEAAAVVLL